MKNYIDTTELPDVYFADVPYGASFCTTNTDDSYIYIKVYYTSSDLYYFNAVRIIDGVMFHFGEYALVKTLE